MNEEQIERILRHTPAVAVPAGLLDQLQQQIRLPQAALKRTNGQALRPWFAGWWRIALTASAFALCLGMPLPAPFRNPLELLLAQASTTTAWAMFSLAGTPVFRHGLMLDLPNAALEVALHCTNSRFLMVVVIASLLVGNLFLRSLPGRLLLTASVIPLAILKTGLQVFTLGQLIVHVGSRTLDSGIQTYLETFFSVLFLMLLFGLFNFLRISERAQAR